MVAEKQPAATTISPLSILILGGTGAMGTPLTQMLAEQGHQVIVTSRKARHSDNPHIRYVQGNAQDINFLRQLVEGQHYDAIVDYMSYSTDRFRQVYQLLLAATNQYVFTSSARVFAPLDTPIKEDSPRLLDVCKDEAYLRTDEYALAKARQEDLLRQSGQTNWTIIRPSITYNDYRLQMGAFDKEDWLYRALKGRAIVISRDVADKKTAMTHGRDVVAGVFALIGRKEAFGKAFNIATNKSYTWRQILDIYLDALEAQTGKRPRVVETDVSVKMRDGARWQVLYARAVNRTFDNSAIAQFVDVTRFVDPKDGLREALTHFLQAPHFDHINWSHEAWHDQQTHEHTPLSEIPTWRHKVDYLCQRHHLNFLLRMASKAEHLLKRIIP